MSAPPDPSVSNADYYDAFAETYEDRRHEGYHLMIDDIESDLVTRAAEGRLALEVGCGTGLILERTARVASRAVGIDLSAGMIGHAKSRGLDVQIASATDLPFADNTFHVTYSFKVLAHVPPLERALAEMARVTKPGGRVFIELYNKHSLRYAIRRLRGGEGIGQGFDDNQVFFRFHSPAEMERALPPTLRLRKRHGVRLFTTLPSMVSWPVVGDALQAAEKRFASSRLARFGGFLVMECEKV
jgi:ubiquinone/menaquinone biosynthesis C-methylase UbiE